MKFIVYTPPYERQGEGYYSPPEYGSDVVEVSAATRRKALVEGLRALRRQRSRWISDQESDGKSPFNGLKAERKEMSNDERNTTSRPG